MDLSAHACLMLVFSSVAMQQATPSFLLFRRCPHALIQSRCPRPSRLDHSKPCMRTVSWMDAHMMVLTAQGAGHGLGPPGAVPAVSAGGGADGRGWTTGGSPLGTSRHPYFLCRQDVGRASFTSLAAFRTFHRMGGFRDFPHAARAV